MLVTTVRDIEKVIERPGKLLTISENATIAEAAAKMSHNNVGCLLVFDMQDKFTGVVTERDILAKVTTKRVPPRNFLVRNIMTRNPISCSRDTTIEEIEHLMANHRIRHVPIVQKDTPVGMISSRDVIAYQLENNKAMKAAAEQLAMLSTELKNLSIKDVVSLAIDEVPKCFNAKWAVLCLPYRSASDLVIYRRDCPIARSGLLNPQRRSQLPHNDHIISTDVCDICENIGARSPSLVIPLTIQDQLDKDADLGKCSRGFLCMCRFNSARPDSKKLRLYKASLLQEILSVNLTNAKLYQHYQQARLDSQRDPLTQVGSRRLLDEVLWVEYARATRYNHSFSIAIVDVDNFKQINDTAGHAAGDRALQRVADIMRTNARTTDVIIIRYGGDEFVLLMPETKLTEAAVLLERLRRQVKAIRIPGIASISISCGIAEWTGSPDETPETILNQADSALYEAKRAGRNRV
ncbi:MAG: diguanylate cyclase, partial [Planctomycetota bacterium]